MLDVHTHIMPGVDDGSRSVEQSLLMLKKEAEQGVAAVVLTPHYEAQRESPAEFVQRRSTAQKQLLAALNNEDGLPELITGAEVAFFDGISRVKELQSLCIEGTSCMLIEMPFCAWSRRMLDELAILQQVCGVKPILAHIERYRAFQPANLFEQLSEGGIWLQCNTSFFTRWQTALPAMAMLKRHLVNFVASDCHGIEHRPPDVGIAMEKIQKKLGKEALEFLRWNEQRLLGG